MLNPLENRAGDLIDKKYSGTCLEAIRTYRFLDKDIATMMEPIASKVYQIFSLYKGSDD